MKVTFEHFSKIHEEDLKFAVIVARFKNKWIFVKHRNRYTFEIPGGSREPHEPILVTARRELFEETGALEFCLTPICVYAVSQESAELGRGLLCYSEVTQLGQLPTFEIGSVHMFDTLPTGLTYPEIQPYLFEKTQAWLEGI